MLSEAQIQYLNEVLGTSVENYRSSNSIQTWAFSAVVVTGPLSPAESELLDRILTSVQLSDAPRFVSEDPQSWSLPEGVHAQHILVFSDRVMPGRSERVTAVWWGLSPLSRMLGEGPEVAPTKKAVWKQLQAMNKERLSL